MKCNLCGNDRFIDMGIRKKVQCAGCGSLERTRLLWMYIERLKLDKTANVLHFAPEKGLYDVLSKHLDKKNYTVADINPNNYPFVDSCRQMDLCDLDEQIACEYDLIIHSHVLEHTPCNIAYTLFHLHRMLKKSGTHLCIVPFMGGKYDESFQALSDEERQRRFGQPDHVRRFGCQDIPSHLGKLITIPTEFDATQDFTPDDLEDANIPENNWKGFHIATVLDLKKHDMKFMMSND